ncbi:hypothetical protein WH47_08402 [Habropoda laboriosa]|uniref:Uncharacterized protein n=1 Tax=Habropoda laboriosa TaxID=597456 RepID=A0A0L7RHD7_9HYME|nr:hypothetical protein WH47_08402 [Habropoda laboriosa]
MIFLVNELQDLLEEVPFAIGTRMCFQLDRALAHCDHSIRKTLNNMFPNRWIRR